MNVSKEAAELLHMFETHGDIYLVGGCVRDFVMGLPIHDEDITTSLTPDEVSGVLRKNGYPVIPVGARFGTINTLVDGVNFEITTFRKEMGYSDGRHPDGVEYSRCLEDDASRRDFTCNAMYYSLKNDTIIDLYDGVGAIHRNELCAVGSASDRFQEDALRMMRAVRICTVKGFDMSTDVMSAIQDNKRLIQNVSAERKFAELTKILRSDHPDRGFRLLDESGLLKEVLPEIAALKLCEQNNPYHGENVFEHTMHALSSSANTDVVRWSVLLHDIGKPKAKVTDVSGTDHFYGHADLSKHMAGDVLKRLRSSNEFKNDVMFCVGVHDTKYVGRLKTKLVRAYVKNYHQAGLFERNQDAMFDVQIADKLAHKGISDVDKQRDIALIEDTRVVLRELLDGPHHMSDLSVDGLEMMNLGLAPKEIPLMKEKLLHGLMLNRMSDKDAQLQFVEGNVKAVHKEYVQQSEKKVRRLPDVPTNNVDDIQVSL